METIVLMFEKGADCTWALGQIQRMACVLDESFGERRLRLTVKSEHGELTGWYLQHKNEHAMKLGYVRDNEPA